MRTGRGAGARTSGEAWPASPFDPGSFRPRAASTQPPPSLGSCRRTVSGQAAGCPSEQEAQSGHPSSALRVPRVWHRGPWALPWEGAVLGCVAPSPAFLGPEALPFGGEGLAVSS